MDNLDILKIKNYPSINPLSDRIEPISAQNLQSTQVVGISTAGWCFLLGGGLLVLWYVLK